MKYTLIKKDAAGDEYEEIEYGSFLLVAERWLELQDTVSAKSQVEYRVEDEEGEEFWVDELSPSEIKQRAPKSIKHWEICDRCRGDGFVLIDGLEGVAFTMSEFNEAFDPDERERYFNGGYDRPCPDCNGTGKVFVLDLEALERIAPRLAKHRRDWLEDEWETNAMYEAERRMGA